jgi:hypothetical protein
MNSEAIRYAANLSMRPQMNNLSHYAISEVAFTEGLSKPKATA